MKSISIVTNFTLFIFALLLLNSCSNTNSLDKAYPEQSENIYSTILKSNLVSSDFITSNSDFFDTFTESTVLGDDFYADDNVVPSYNMEHITKISRIFPTHKRTLMVMGTDDMNNVIFEAISLDFKEAESTSVTTIGYCDLGTINIPHVYAYKSHFVFLDDSFNLNVMMLEKVDEDTLSLTCPTTSDYSFNTSMQRYSTSRHHLFSVTTNDTTYQLMTYKKTDTGFVELHATDFPSDIIPTTHYIHDIVTDRFRTHVLTAAINHSSFQLNVFKNPHQSRETTHLETFTKTNSLSSPTFHFFNNKNAIFFNVYSGPTLHTYWYDFEYDRAEDGSISRTVSISDPYEVSYSRDLATDYDHVLVRSHRGAMVFMEDNNRLILKRLDVDNGRRGHRFHSRSDKDRSIDLFHESITSLADLPNLHLMLHHRGFILAVGHRIYFFHKKRSHSDSKSRG
ncbi:hypothetical protein DID76_01830 [Candidatus Marinamargulisbacteria bacterium SCGC AG-414-C22]|nr:hypothetical protein DID76_01830 [Candidatus Marinamargulisbacteria bacterium SCGC AG-414-C22]